MAKLSLMGGKSILALGGYVDLIGYLVAKVTRSSEFRWFLIHNIDFFEKALTLNYDECIPVEMRLKFLMI